MNAEENAVSDYTFYSSEGLRNVKVQRNIEPSVKDRDLATKSDMETCTYP